MAHAFGTRNGHDTTPCRASPRRPSTRIVPGTTPCSACHRLRPGSADQVINGFGLDAQRQAITAYATAQGWEIVGIKEDQGTSGTYGVADGQPTDASSL
jgi:hypothetical protein